MRKFKIAVICLIACLWAVPVQAACTSVYVYVTNLNPTKTLIVEMTRRDNPSLVKTISVEPDHINHMNDCPTAWFMVKKIYNYTIKIYHKGETDVMGAVAFNLHNTYSLSPQVYSIDIDTATGYCEAFAQITDPLFDLRAKVTIHAR